MTQLAYTNGKNDGDFDAVYQASGTSLCARAKYQNDPVQLWRRMVVNIAVSNTDGNRLDYDLAMEVIEFFKLSKAEAIKNEALNRN